MSRLNTTIGYLSKLYICGHLTPSDGIIIHILGSNESECGKLKQSEIELTDLYGPLFVFLTDRKYKHVNIHFIGPAVPHHDYGASSSFTFFSLQGLQVNIQSSRLVYECIIDNEGFVSPDIILLFNSGIWGYDSWIPTLRSIHNLRSSLGNKQCYSLLTSYTLEESEDDYDKIIEVFTSVCVPQWLWACDINPYRSRDVMKEVSLQMGRDYYEQYAWSCFYFN